MKVYKYPFWAYMREILGQATPHFQRLSCMVSKHCMAKGHPISVLKTWSYCAGWWKNSGVITRHGYA